MFDELAKFFGFNESSEMELTIVSPRKNRKGYAKKWRDLHSRKKRIRTYDRDELTDCINGRKVKHWIFVYEADDAEGDEFVPVFI